MTKPYRSLYESLYQAVADDLFTCAYCGEAEEGFDHVPPLALVDRFGPSKFHTFLLYPSCQECNNTLGDQPLLSKADRAEFVLNRFKTRYAKLLNMPAWEPADFKGTEELLRTYIKQSVKEKEVLNRRLRFLANNCRGK